MQCDICLRTGGAGRPFLCATDARNRLYEDRVRHAQVLIEKDALDREATALLEGQAADDVGEPRRPYVDRLTAEREQAKDRTRQIIAHADELRAKVERARGEIAERRAALARRRRAREEAARGIEARRERQGEDVEKGVRMMRYKWNQVHAVTAASRAFLCGEAAKLYGMRRVRRGSSDEYMVGGVGIVDLLSMNTASPAQISTSLSHIVHLLMLSTHYLAIRLPAEITLPHRDYPLPTIFPLSSSYKHENVPFPGTLLTPLDRADAPPASDAEQEPDRPRLPRPRPLFVGKPLPMLATEDAAAHNLFLEGATLLAYDVAWLCRSQGVPVGEGGSTATFEDVCDVGRNLFNLLVASQGRGGPGNVKEGVNGNGNGKRATTKDGEERGRERRGSQTTNTTSTTNTANLMGHYSHGTAHSFLGGAAGAEFTRGFKLPSPTKLADKLKSRLASEVANAEWEVLDPDAWIEEAEEGGEASSRARGEGHEGHDEEALGGDDGIVVGARRESVDGLLGGGASRRHAHAHAYGAQSFMSMRTIMDAVEVVGGVAAGERRPGTSGWTKVKPR